MSENITYKYQPSHIQLDTSTAIDVLKQRISNPIVTGAVPATDSTVLQRITAEFVSQAIQLRDLRICPEEYAMFMDHAGYHERYTNYYSLNLAEKSFEHFAALQLLGMNEDDVFIDLASEGSPLPEITSRLFHAEAFAQDIMYEPGVHENRIGGDACDMPVPNAFASKAALTCSLEHFEASGDIKLFQESGRVLKRGGKVCVIPLYLYSFPATQTDARYSAVCDVP